MNDLPIDWSDQLRSAYPARSGPSGWQGMKLMLALRRALFSSTWNDIIEGVKRYAAYCEQAGIAGSSFVKSPQTFIEDGSWAEVYEFQPTETKEQKERREIADRDRLRMERAKEAGRACNPPIEPMRGESVGAYETRVRLGEQPGGETPSGGNGSGDLSAANRQPAGRPAAPVGQPVHLRVAALAERMRVK